MRTIAFGLCLLLAGTLSAQPKKIKWYSFKTAIVEYVFEGNTTGRQNLYIDDHGWMQCEMTQSTTKMFGQTTESKEVKLTKGLEIYQWDPMTRMGTKMHNSILEELVNDPNFDMQEFAKRTMEGLGFEKTGNETVKSWNCEVWKGMGSTIWIWNNIAVKTEVKLLGQKTVMVANKVQFDVPLPAGRFDIPFDIKFNDAGNLDPMGMMNNAMEQAEQEGGVQQEQSEEGEQEEAPIKSLKDLKGLLKKIK